MKLNLSSPPLSKPHLSKIWLVFVALGVSALCVLQFYQSRRFTLALDQSHSLSHRLQAIDATRLEFEKYRLSSRDFRTLSELQLVAAKNHLRQVVQTLATLLASEAPVESETARVVKLQKQLEGFMKLSAELEPMLFLKDVYYRDEARAAHNSMLATLSEIRQASASRLELSQQSSKATSRDIMIAQLAIAGAVVLFGFAWLLSNFINTVRPLRRLMIRAREVGHGRYLRLKKTTLGGVHGEIESVIDRLADQVGSQQRERHRFLAALAQELRLPLGPLQASARLIVSHVEPLTLEQRGAAEGQIHRSVMSLNRTLDDLADTLEVDAGSLALVEQTVDLREILSRSAALWQGGGSMHQVCTVLPPQPVWGFVDSARLERVLTNLVSKMTQLSPQGGRIDLTIVISRSGGGIEVVVSESGSQGRASGPELELMKHWISENGFGLAVSQEVLQAHGGQVLAAGVAGTQIVFRIRLPEDRFPSGVESLRSLEMAMLSARNPIPQAGNLRGSTFRPSPRASAREFRSLNP